MASVPHVMCLLSSSDDLSLLPALVSVGVDGFQVRDKFIEGRQLTELTRRVLCTDAIVIVNDRIDVALAAGAHGVHLGASDVSVADARRIAPDLLIGVTCRNRVGLEGAAAAGADYAGVGPVFPTSSKNGLPDPLGPSALNDLTGVLPMLAIGGITADNVMQIPAGIGVAVIGGIWSANDPVRAAARIVEAVHR